MLEPICCHVVQMRFVDGEKWWVREDGPIKLLTDLWDGALNPSAYAAPTLQALGYDCCSCECACVVHDMFISAATMCVCP